MQNFWQLLTGFQIDVGFWTPPTSALIVSVLNCSLRALGGIAGSYSTMLIYQKPPDLGIWHLFCGLPSALLNLILQDMLHLWHVPQLWGAAVVWYVVLCRQTLQLDAKQTAQTQGRAYRALLRSHFTFTGQLFWSDFPSQSAGQNCLCSFPPELILWINWEFFSTVMWNLLWPPLSWCTKLTFT